MNQNSSLSDVKKDLQVFFEQTNFVRSDFDIEKLNPFLNFFSKNENSIKIIIDVPEFKVLGISENVESVIGYDNNYILEKNMQFLFDVLLPEHSNFPVTAVKMAVESYMLTPEEKRHNVLHSFCGLHFQHKNGQTKKGLIRYYPLYELNNGQTAIVTIDDISHLLKANFFWGRLTHGNDKDLPTEFHFFSNDVQLKKGDIITNREKEILTFIAKGIESKEIAKTLYISTNTVDNHRRNMIARTGTRDSTALIQLCRMCGII